MRSERKTQPMKIIILLLLLTASAFCIDIPVSIEVAGCKPEEAQKIRAFFAREFLLLQDVEVNDADPDYVISVTVAKDGGMTAIHCGVGFKSEKFIKFLDPKEKTEGPATKLILKSSVVNQLSQTEIVKSEDLRDAINSLVLSMESFVFAPRRRATASGPSAP